MLHTIINARAGYILETEQLPNALKCSEKTKDRLRLLVHADTQEFQVLGMKVLTCEMDNYEFSVTKVDDLNDHD